MRELMLKEARDVAPAALGVTLLGAGVAALVGLDSHFALPPLALLCAGLGVAVGIAQGLLDRRRRDDPFLLHRPISPVRLHWLRGVVGTAYATVAAIGAASVLPLVPSAYQRNFGSRPDALPSGMQVWQYERIDPTGVEIVVCVVGAVLFHAVARLALSARRPLVAALLLVVLCPMVLYALLGIGTQAAPWLAFAAVLGVCTTLGNLNLARRPA
jgi:hypothetical protein